MASKNEKRVSVRLFKDNYKYRNDVSVCVNGKFYKIQRGVEVEVPEAVAEALEHSARQDEYTASVIEREKDAYRKASKEM